MRWVHLFSGSILLGSLGGCFFRTAGVAAFPSFTTATGRRNRRSRSVPTLAQSFQYARGAEIWPECNQDPVQLQDSFPHGNIPYSAILLVDQVDMQAVHEDTLDDENISGMSSRRRDKARYLVRKTVRRLLRRAAAKEELETEQVLVNPSWQQSLRGRLIALLAAALILQGFVRPLDILLVATLTSYYIILGMIARSPRQGGMAPIMPSMPPQGHVPTIVAHPLGFGATYNRAYEIWLQAGVGLGIILPVLSILVDQSVILRKPSGDSSSLVAVRLCARPLFLLCCQAVSETYSKLSMVSS
jgi:hypothetical protein